MKYLLIPFFLIVGFLGKTQECGVAEDDIIFHNSHQLKSDNEEDWDLLLFQIQFHIIRENNGSGGLQDQSLICYIIEELNIAFAPINVQFFTDMS